MYEDGVFVTSQDMSFIGDINNGSPFRIGADIDGDYNYNGAIEEVRIWNKVLSQPEINNWKCNPINNTHPSYSDLIGYWSLNEGTGNIANDQSILNNDGSITNPTWSDLNSIVTFDNTPRIPDIAVTALDWLCIDPQNYWNLDGFSWTDTLSAIVNIVDNTPGSIRSTIFNSCPEDTIYFHPALDLSDFLLNEEI